MVGVNFGNIKNLIFGIKFNQSLEGINFCNIEFIDFGQFFNQNLENVNWRKIEEVRLISNTRIKKEQFPENIKVIYSEF